MEELIVILLILIDGSQYSLLLSNPSVPLLKIIAIKIRISLRATVMHFFLCGHILRFTPGLILSNHQKNYSVLGDQ